jgi:hypothetical protein
MPITSAKTAQDMPIWARILAGLLGVGLLVIGLCEFLFLRPLGWELAGVAFAAIGLAVDLLLGAVRGRWPCSALVWLGG